MKTLEAELKDKKARKTKLERLQDKHSSVIRPLKRAYRKAEAAFDSYSGDEEGQEKLQVDLEAAAENLSKARQDFAERKNELNQISQFLEACNSDMEVMETEWTRERNRESKQVELETALSEMGALDIGFLSSDGKDLDEMALVLKVVEKCAEASLRKNDPVRKASSLAVKIASLKAEMSK